MIRTLPLLVWLYLAASLFGQDPSASRVADLLPPDAQVIETASVATGTAKARMLVLWMRAPQRVMSTWDSGDAILYGDHWFGPAYLSLIDPSEARLINTIQIRADRDFQDGDSLPIPFFTYDYSTYYVPHPDSDHRGVPIVLHLRDLTGEGVAGQFVLFDYVASAVEMGTVLGYSARSDTAVQYPVEITENKFHPVVETWALQVFSYEPSRPGTWEFTWEPAHGSEVWIDEEVRFDRMTQRFVERKTTSPYPGSAQVHCEVDTASLTNFLAHMQTVGQDWDGQLFPWLQDLIAKATPDKIDSLGMVLRFRGDVETLSIKFQVSASGGIGLYIQTDADLAAALQAELKSWCSPN